MTALTAESEMAARGVVATTATLAPTVATQTGLCSPGRTPSRSTGPRHCGPSSLATYRDLGNRHNRPPPTAWSRLGSPATEDAPAAETRHCPGIRAQISPTTTPTNLVNRSPPFQATEREPSQVIDRALRARCTVRPTRR